MTFEELIKENDSYFRSLARKACAKRQIDFMTADDYYQVGISRIWENWHKFDPERNNDRVKWAGHVFTCYINAEADKWNPIPVDTKGTDSEYLDRHIPDRPRKRDANKRIPPERFVTSLDSVVEDEDGNIGQRYEYYMSDHRSVDKEMMEWEDALAVAISQETDPVNVQIINMRLLGYKLDQIADLIGTTYTTASARWRRICQRMGEKLNKIYGPRESLGDPRPPYLRR